ASASPPPPLPMPPATRCASTSARIGAERASMARRLILLVVALLGFAPAHGEEATGADRGAIRAVIEQQLAAFQRDDGEAAFAFASPGIRAQFQTAETFMSMVRSGYPPVYRPREVQFGELAT